MKDITEAAWSRVHEKACDIVNASTIDDVVMVSVFTDQLMVILDELEVEFGPHPEFYDTRADFLDDPDERMRLYRRALKLAREKNDEGVTEEILESMKTLQEDLKRGYDQNT